MRPNAATDSATIRPMFCVTVTSPPTSAASAPCALHIGGDAFRRVPARVVVDDDVAADAGKGAGGGGTDPGGCAGDEDDLAIQIRSHGLLQCVENAGLVGTNASRARVDEAKGAGCARAGRGSLLNFGRLWPYRARPPRHVSIDRLRDDVARRAGDERLDVVDELVGEDLHRPLAGPGDVRREDEIGQVEIEQRVAGARRLDAQHVEAGAGDRAAAQRIGQRAARRPGRRARC